MHRCLLRVVGCLVVTVASGCYRGDEGLGAEGASAGPTSMGTSEAESGADTAPTATPAGCEPTTEGLRTAVFEPSCNRMACHDASAAGGLDLGVSDLEAVLVEIPSATCSGEIRVVPGDPTASFLYTKLLATATCGLPMPVGAALDPELVECVAAWIEAVESTCETCGTASCIDTMTDAAHCGDCTTVCPAGVACVDAACDCPTGTELCAGACVDTNSNPDHCGGCDAACNGASVCLAGGCASDCGDVLMACDGACVDVTMDAQNCGDCTTSCAVGESCIASECVCEGALLGYAADIEPILAAQCTMMGCHGGVNPAEDLDLRAGAGYSDLVGVASEQCGDRMRVQPGDPSSSYLLDKVMGVDLCFGTKMPKMGPGLTAAQIDAISQWICNGADP